MKLSLTWEVQSVVLLYLLTLRLYLYQQKTQSRNVLFSNFTDWTDSTNQQQAHRLTCWAAVVAQERASPPAALRIDGVKRSVGKMHHESKSKLQGPVFYCWLIFINPFSSALTSWIKTTQRVIMIHSSHLKVFIPRVRGILWCQIST